MYMLQWERSATTASAEASANKAMAEMEVDRLKDAAQIAPEDCAQWTNDYVQAHSIAMHT